MTELAERIAQLVRKLEMQSDYIKEQDRTLKAVQSKLTEACQRERGLVEALEYVMANDHGDTYDPHCPVCNVIKKALTPAQKDQN